MAPIATFIKHRTGETIAAERVAAKMDEQLNMHTLKLAVKNHVKIRITAYPYELCTSPSSLDKDVDRQSDHRRSKPHTRSCCRHRCQGKDEKAHRRRISRPSRTSRSTTLKTTLTPTLTCVTTTIEKVAV